MKTASDSPRTLQEAIRYFADADRALAFVVQLRWPKGVTCPACGAAEPSFLKTRRIWKCRDCHRQFSAKLGTIFEDSPLGFDKWLPALWMLANCKNGISSYELARALGVTQKSAWFMLRRIRMAMRTRTFKKFGGEVEVDETFVGGLAKFMHKSKRERVIKGTGGMNKTKVVGVLMRQGRGGKASIRIRANVVPDVTMSRLQPHVEEAVRPGAKVYTDAAWQYGRLADDYRHAVIDHNKGYVRGRVHTNGLENFWSLLKRAVKGTYVSVDPFHLSRYVDEQVFRFNHRDVKDGQRFAEVLRRVFGKRLTYGELTGASFNFATT
jgi:transposase-like protein